MDLMTGSATVAYQGVYIHQHIGGHAQVILPLSTIETNLFAAGGHYWSAQFICHNTYGSHPFLFIRLRLWSRDVKVKASWELSVIDPQRRLTPTTLYSAPPQGFAASEQTGWDLDCAFITDQCFSYVDTGRIVLQIVVTVVPDDEDDPAPAEKMTIGKQIDVDQVPPSDMLDQLGEVFRTREGADVTYYVGGELFPAHKIVLATRSRVFKAQLYGEMKESGAQQIVVRDMTADTFRALLHYIYTDSWPPARSNSNQQQEERCQGNDSRHVWDLLKAADLYSVERLKVICERILAKKLDVDNVAEMLRQADRHHCSTLKDACIKFMTTSERMGHVMKSQGFLDLKHSDPRLLVEVLEKSSKF